MPDIVCDNCGGTDFYKEAGYYYCNGCQIQSQEVQEYVFDEFAAFGGGEQATRGASRKLQSDKSGKTENQITSWECYNYILLGLTEELINLGANEKLKSVVRILWLRYLEKLEVFKRGHDQLPKLQPFSSGKDGEVVYGKHPKKKRKRTSSSSETSTSRDTLSVKRERAKRKRELIRAHYEEYSQKSQGTPSLHNETLTSLQTGSEKSSLNTVQISYNKFASKELKKIKHSYYHWRKHRCDHERNLTCHQIGYRNVSYKFKVNPSILSLNKLYSILFLGLLIVKDKIQLSDILRFIQEGHLSFNCYSHFFPEEYSDKHLNFRNFKKNSLFSSGPFRTLTSEMAAFLRVDCYVSCPNLVELCERYCKEMNLPKDICDCAKNILSKSKMKMSFRKRAGKVPNYEGRVLSVILFVVKLLFGLDDVTEFHLARYSDILNKSSSVNPKMFNVVCWLKYIEYRTMILANHHFPTSFRTDGIKNLSLALGVIGKKEYPTDVRFARKKDNYKQVLERLKEGLLEPRSIDFPVTLTPFFDYVKLIPETNCLEILNEDYTNESMVHILRPANLLNVVNNGISPEIINGGANDDWILEQITCCKMDSKKDLKEKRKFVTVKLTLDSAPNKNDTASNETEIDSNVYREDFQIVNERSFRKNLSVLQTRFADIDLDVDRIRRDLDDTTSYDCHYNPYERFWMRTRIRLEELRHDDCQKFVDGFPYSFRLIFKECQRIAQQSEQEFLVEYQLTELFLTYWVNYKKKIEKREVNNRLVANFLERCTPLW